MTVHAKSETKIVLGLIALFTIAIVALLLMDGDPAITAVCAGLIVTACMYRFFGGTEGSTLTVASVKATGSFAVFGAVAYTLYGPLQSNTPLIAPEPTEWIAIDRTGKPVDIRIGQIRLSPDTELLTDAEWSVESRDGVIRVVAGDETLAKVDPESLRSVGLFSEAGMADNRVIKFTDPLEPGDEADLNPPYPFRIRADEFSDDFNVYSIMDTETDTAIRSNQLLTRTFDVFNYKDRTYVILVSEAAHDEPNRAPWAVFGFAELELGVR